MLLFLKLIWFGWHLGTAFICPEVRLPEPSQLSSFLSPLILSTTQRHSQESMTLLLDTSALYATLAHTDSNFCFFPPFRLSPSPSSSPFSVRTRDEYYLKLEKDKSAARSSAISSFISEGK